jgi:tight adherence protein B
VKILLACLVSVFCFSLLALFFRARTRERTQVARRLASISEQSVQPLNLSRGEVVLEPKERMWEMLRSLAGGFRGLIGRSRFDLKMQQVDWPLLGSEFEILLILLGAICGLVAFALTLAPLALLFGFMGGVLLGLAWLEKCIEGRRNAFTNQLCDMLTTIANALRAGFSFMQAFELVAKEMEAPASYEVEKVISETNVGLPLEEALGNMQKRVGSPDFELVIAAVLIQRQVGGNLAQVLDTISGTIAERISMRREVLALTAQGRLSGVILALLPVALAGFMAVVNPGYLRPLIDEPLGRLAMAIAGGLELLGFLIIRRLVDIKV